MTFDIPNKDGLWVFNSYSSWQTWVKPTQYNNFIIYVCGGGGGGAVGQTGVSGSSRYGGGGGASGGLLIVNSPSFLLPEILYMYIGNGGLSGVSGGTTYLCYFPNTNAANIITSANGGGSGLLSAGGAGITPTISQSIFSISTTISSAGTTGGTGAVGSVYALTPSCIYSGTGGGGVDVSNVGYEGGYVLASNVHPQLNGGAVASNGNTGYLIKKPFTALGGTGGGGNPSGTGGVGGNGVWGSGGGGGGGGITGGAGGKGGDGFIIIIGY
jgi:hypothetical protein